MRKKIYCDFSACLPAHCYFPYFEFLTEQAASKELHISFTIISTVKATREIKFIPKDGGQA